VLWKKRSSKRLSYFARKPDSSQTWPEATPSEEVMELLFS